MKEPLVSIVTPSYNQGRFIRATIESVLAQDYPNIEYIIMDGGSTDETAAVVKEYASRLTWISEKDRGQSHAINKGFRMAKGEIVSWLNSDDVILPGAVRHAVNAFERRPDAGAVYGEGYQIDIEGKIKGRFPHTEKPFNLWKLVYLWDYILQQTLYLRKEVVEEVGYVDEDLHWALDWDLLIRIGKRYPIEYIPEYMGCIREYDEAKSFSGGSTRFWELARAMRRHGNLRYPPGYFVFGLDTYEKIWCGAIERWTPSFLRWPSEKFRRLFSIALRSVIDRTVREAQGWYADGWATTRVRCMLPAGKGRIVIRGKVPEHAAGLRGQSLTVTCNGKTMLKARVNFGDFEIALPFDSVPESVELSLSASRYFIPRNSGPSSDSRRLAYVLKRVEWAD